MLDLTKPLRTKKRGGGVRVIPTGKWWINRNTPVGDDAELWEEKPWSGRRQLRFDKVWQEDSDGE